MKTEQKKRFTRAEVIALMAAAYREEQALYHALARDTRLAAHAGEAAEYARLDEAARLQERCMEAMMKMVAALDIDTEEFMRAVNDGMEAEEP